MERKITITEKTLYHEGYEIKMLQENELKGVLKVQGRGVDESSYYDYDVSGKIAMQALYERALITGTDIRNLLKQMMVVIKEVEKHLLNIHGILIHPEYIFYEEEHFYFCYYPLSKENVWESFHVLTEYLVKKADYQDEDAVQLVFMLHKETMKENYSLEKVIEKCLETKEEQIKKEKEEENRVRDEVYDRITEQEMGSIVMEETENMWSPVRRFFRRHKKPKWGDWDGLYIEEEDL